MTQARLSPFERLLGICGGIGFGVSVVSILVLLIAAQQNQPHPELMKAAVIALLLSLLLREFIARRMLQEAHLSKDKRLKEIEEKSRLLSLTETTAQIGHWRVDLINDEVFWSDGTFAIHGLKPGTPPSLEDAITYFLEEDREIVSSAIEFSRKTGKPYSFRARLIDAQGRLRHTSSTALVDTDENGTPVALFGVFQDRSHDEILIEELRKARDDAHALSRTKTAFLAKMSHEIRTPMNGVLGFAELLSKTQLSPEQRRHVQLISESGESLQSLLNDILDLSKIEAGRIDCHPMPTDLAHLARQATQLMQPIAGEKSIKLGVTIAQNVPRYVKLDALRTRQILNNLLANAIRFTDSGGVTTSVEINDKQVVIKVKDSGVGIPPDMTEAIFDTFTQVENTHGIRRGGTGLGLTISRQLARLMGGDLEVESALGLGSTFTLTLPFVASPSKSRSVKPATKSEAQQVLDKSRFEKARILLVEDFDINRELVVSMGENLGAHFDVAVDGQDGVEKVVSAKRSGTPYDLVLMDLQMPRLDGLSAARTIRQTGINADELPIVALTANAFADDLEACMRAGMQEHLSKPINQDTLHKSLSRWLGDKPQTSAKHQAA